MKQFCIPADFKTETIDKLVELNGKYHNSRVIETYGNITKGQNFGSGRAINQLPDIDISQLEKYVLYSQKNNIAFNYSLNAPFMGNKEFTEEELKTIISFLKQLKNIGVTSLTVALPSLIEIVKYLDWGFEVKVSAINNVDSLAKSMHYKNMGVKRIVVAESIHRKFQTLKNICDGYGDGIEVIVNTMCHTNCSYRHFHYNQVGADSKGVPNDVSVNFYEHRCMMQRYKTQTEMLKLGWIRPEDINYYYNIGVKHFKLQGRQHVATGGHLKTLEYYMKEDFEGNLMALLDMFNSRYSFEVAIDNKKLGGFIKPFVEKESFCDSQCASCNYCGMYAEKAIDIEKSDKVISLAKMFYSQTDKLSKMVDSLKTNC